jgi:hypothetical protein
LSLALVAATGLAWADPKAEAREHFDRAMALVDQGALQQAIVEFRRAYDLMPHYTVLYNIGQAYVALGKPVEAVDTYTRYLEEGAERVNKARRAEVESELSRQKAKIGEVTLRVEPPGARVSVDGKDVGEAPLEQPVRLAAGNHTIEASLVGHEPAARQVSVVGQGQETVELVLRPVSEPAEAKALLRVDCPVPDVSVSVDGAVVARTPLAAPQPVAAGTHRVSFSRAGYVSHEQTATLVPGSTTAVDCGVVRVVTTPVPEQEYRPAYASRARRQRIWALASAGGGVALGAAALGAYLWNDHRYSRWDDEQDALDSASGAVDFEALDSRCHGGSGGDRRCAARHWSRSVLHGG